jgi:large subunit ribosomal protein L6
MSRIVKNPVPVPSGVKVTLGDGTIAVKGAKGELSMAVHGAVSIRQEDDRLVFDSDAEAGQQGVALAGTTRSLVNNMVIGVTDGFERKLVLQGVGYRAQAKGKGISLSLGFSHPVEYELPEGMSADVPSQTEIVLKGIDKQQLGQVAAEIRALRPPEPYKGKGVRYADEHVRRKEAKKK